MEKKEPTFWEHLDELRGSLITCLYVFFGGFIAFYFVSDRILDFLRMPLFKHLPVDQQKLYYTGLFENFLVHLKVSGYTSLFLLSPVYFVILWKFVSPGLYEKERKQILPFVYAGSLFFLIGAAFAYFVLFPAGVKYFISYGTPAESALLTLDSYISVILRILFGFGICFEIPVVVVLLAKIGMIKSETLMKHRRTAIIIIASISAVVAPPDAISMLMLMCPLYVLFEGSIWVVKIIDNPKKS